MSYWFYAQVAWLVEKRQPAGWFGGQWVLIGGEVLKGKLLGCRSYCSRVWRRWVSVRAKGKAWGSEGGWLFQGTVLVAAALSWIHGSLVCWASCSFEGGLTCKLLLLCGCFAPFWAFGSHSSDLIRTKLPSRGAGVLLLWDTGLQTLCKQNLCQEMLSSNRAHTRAVNAGRKGLLRVAGGCFSTLQHCEQGAGGSDTTSWGKRKL